MEDRKLQRMFASFVPGRFLFFFFLLGLRVLLGIVISLDRVALASKYPTSGLLVDVGRYPDSAQEG